MITVAPQAAVKMKEYMRARGKEGKCLRIWLKGLGCRTAYGMAFDEFRPGDVRVESEGLAIVLDPLSAEFLRGSHLVWVEGSGGPGGFALTLPGPDSGGTAPEGTEKLPTGS
ncbi:MAG: iron-sulfur cluster assembly accessory protein [Firmicutes bacterium]|nr:iron-sulfur cluster assembly accessory protein [Bacillota bacterium]